MLLMLAAKAVAMLKDIVVAQAFGTGPEVDQFVLAMVLPTACVMLAITPLDGAASPHLLRLHAVQRRPLIHRISLYILGYCSLVATVVAAGSAWWFGWPWASLALWALPGGLIAYWGFTGNALGYPRAVAATTVITPLCVLLVLWLWPHEHAWIAAHISGAGLEALLLLCILRHWSQQQPLVATTTLPPLHPVWQQYRLLFIGAALLNLAPLIDQSMASQLDGGAVAALNYAVKIPGAVLSLVGSAIAALLLPILMRSGNDPAQVWRLTGIAFGLGLGLLGCLLWSGPYWVAVLFERGAFDADDTAWVARIQSAYALQLPFYIAAGVLVRAIHASGDNRILLRVSVQNLILNVLGNLALMPVFGAAGIALSTSLVYACSFMTLCWHVRALQRK